MARLSALLFAIFLLGACSTARRLSDRNGRQLAREVTHSAVFARSFTGFVLLDATSGKELTAVNADHYFTPASNTKILTLAACLKVLGDSLPRYRYQWSEGDTSAPEGIWLYSGTGDPTTLHPDFAAWQNKPDFWKKHPVTYEAYPVFMPGAGLLSPYGPGWMWDDLGSDYSAERSVFPIYGNRFSVIWTGNAWKTEPTFFKRYLEIRTGSQEPVRRDPLGPTVFVPESVTYPAGYRVELPMYRPSTLLGVLCQDSSALCPGMANALDDQEWALTDRWYACPVDTAYRRMMYQSDNFFAEQLLLLAAGEKFDTLDPAKLMHWMQDSVWTGFPTPPRWVDGSGLSRYNLFSPRFLALVLRKLWQEQPRSRLFDLFPAGGIDGTLAGSYTGPNGKPYIYAKSGSMSGVYSLSGYLVAKSGRVLIFSCLNNNFKGSNKDWKAEIGRLLEEIYAHW